MFKKILQRIRIGSWKPSKITRGDGGDYLFRWDIIGFHKWFMLRLHKFVAADDDCMHDHPWAFISITLWGSYKEFSPDHKNGSKNFGIGSIKYRPANWIHRVDINSKTCWTLVLTLKDVRQWGFWLKSGQWVPFFRYHHSMCGNDNRKS